MLLKLLGLNYVVVVVVEVECDLITNFSLLCVLNDFKLYNLKYINTISNYIIQIM